MRSPAELTIQSKTGTAANVRQRYWLVSGLHKLDALTRILETETFEGMLVFTRTKQATVELAEKLEARGFSAAPLNGDIPQAQRERTIARLRSGDVDIVVATDVAARGLDVERVGHVVNYDAPYDPESYVHRVGRTGRAGRKGEAILFIAPRERNLLRGIERATRQQIEPMNLPTADAVNARRIEKFKAQIVQAAALEETKRYRPILEQLEAETGLAPIDLAAALATLVQSSTQLLPAQADDLPRPPVEPRREPPREAGSRDARPPRDTGPRRTAAGPMETFRIEVGSLHDIKPGNIVGAIANEAGLDGAYIGRIDIREDHSFVDLPEGMPREIFKTLKQTRLAGRELRITRVERRSGDGFRQREERVMSKGMERKKEDKKKPAKTLEEKRAAKKAKREARG
jgi:ATP-dependent RNA helicase DeaD